MAQSWTLIDVRELEDDEVAEAEMQLHYSELRNVFRVSVCVENSMIEDEFNASADPLLGVSKDDERQAMNMAKSLVVKLDY